jgi:hypothetical protein
MNELLNVHSLTDWLCLIWATGAVAVVICSAVVVLAITSTHLRERITRRDSSIIKPLENPMKLRIALVALLAIAFAAVSLLQTGCSTLGNGSVDIPVVGTPYQAGRTFVFVDTVTASYQPDEVAAVIDEVYVIASMNLTADSLLDEFVEKQIESTFADSTPQARALIFNVYSALKARLDYQIDLNPELPPLDVLTEFNRGITDALAIYQPASETTN